MNKEQLEKIGIFEDNRNVVFHERMDWDTYFMNMAYLISLRSHDSQTAHGSCIVKNNLVISTGFNGFPSGAPDEKIPNIRPFKYKYILHSEENSILNAAKNGIPLNGSVIYITGLPCSDCAKRLVSVGIKEWIVGEKSYQSSEEDVIMRNFWVDTFDVKIKYFPKDKIILPGK